MKHILFAFIIFSGVYAFGQSNARSEVGKVAKVYSGMEGLKVTTCRLGEESKNEALIKFSGIDHPWNNLVFKAALNKYKSSSASNNFNIDYLIEWKGKKYTVLVSKADNATSYKAYLIPYGSLQVEHNLGYDEGGSMYTSCERLLTEYLEQK